MIDQCPHSVGHLDIFTGHVLKSAVQSGRHESQVVADVRPEVEHHGAEDGVCEPAPRVFGRAELNAGHAVPFFFEELLQRLVLQPVLEQMVVAVQERCVELGFEEELVAAGAELGVDRVALRRVEQSRHPVFGGRFGAEQRVAARQPEQFVLVASAVDPVGAELEVRVAVRRREQSAAIPSIIKVHFMVILFPVHFSVPMLQLPLVG